MSVLPSASSLHKRRVSTMCEHHFFREYRPNHSPPRLQHRPVGGGGVRLIDYSAADHGHCVIRTGVDRVQSTILTVQPHLQRRHADGGQQSVAANENICSCCDPQHGPACAVAARAPLSKRLSMAAALLAGRSVHPCPSSVQVRLLRRCTGLTVRGRRPRLASARPVAPYVPLTDHTLGIGAAHTLNC